MKKIIITVALCLITSPAYADVYVKVDAQGNAIGGAIVCEQSVCGDPNSSVSKDLLGAGERFVLQGTGTTGIGNNNPNTQVKVDAENTWTITRTNTVQLPAPITVDNTQIISVNTQAVERFNPVKPEINIQPAPVLTDTSTVVIDTGTAIIDTATSLSDIDFNAPDWFERIMAYINNLIQQLYARLEGLKK